VLARSGGSRAGAVAGAGSYGEDWDETVPGVAAFVASAAVGLILASKRPRNPIGWLLLPLDTRTAIG
jgi:hypothetical protein